METLSEIIASFDIFQVLLSAFPQIFNAIINTFETILSSLLTFFRSYILVHPGLISGVVIFFVVYLAYSRIVRLKKASISSPRSSR